ncbi:hypothetical protein BCD67_07645 [Oscillatoriales cyanobacterium USR001]|nr:hypothetical protein BCD67_07645 [Oscillatoriales cyanobacterium USR001]
MADTLRASEQGLKIVDEARHKKRWRKDALNWAKDATTSTATLKRFWARIAIDRYAFIGICQAVGVDWEQVVELEGGDGPPHYTNIDWGEALNDTQGFVGRNLELATLEKWIINDRCPLVAILGNGGMGKSLLSVALVKQIQQNFKFIIWRSLREAPKLDILLTDLIQRISRERNPENLTAKINVFMEILKTSQYLIVLDNFETIFQGEQNVGKYLPGYENYGDLLTRIGQPDHKSCLVITSREKPSEVAILEGINGPVKAQPLSGLSTEAETILDEKGLSGTPEEKQRLINIYDGNPLALKLISSFITDVFNGEINKFLKKPKIINRGINDLLDQQYQRLQELERSVMYWLAINRELVSRDELEDDLLRPLSEIWPEELSDLKRRSLIETNSSRHTLQNVIMEYMTEKLKNEIYQEIKSGELDKFNSYALLKANSKDNIREVQKRLIIQPIIDKLTTELGSKDEVITHLKGLIDTIRTKKLRGYAAGNLINLLCILKADLTGDDFSGLTIKQAFLRDVELHQVNLENAELENCVFPEVMGEVWQAVFSADGTILAVGDDLGNIHIWDIEKLKKRHTLCDNTEYITSLSFTPGSNTLISFSRDKNIRFWDITTGKSKQSIPIEAETSDKLTVSAISYNQQILATNCLNNGQVNLWDFNTGKHIKTLSGHTLSVTALIFSPNREILVTASKDKSIKVWNVENGQLLITIPEYRDVEGGGIAFNCDGTILAAGSRKDFTIKLWDMSDPNNISHIHTITKAHENEIRALDFSPDGKIFASGSGDKKVKLWNISDIQNIELITTLEGHSSWMHQVKFSPDGKFLIGSSADKTVGVWNVEQPDKAYLIETFRGYNNWIRGLAFSRDGKVLVSGSDDKTLRLWDTENKKLLHTWRGHDERLQMIAFSPDGNTLASSSWDFTVKLWNFSTDTPRGECVETFSEHTDQLYCVAFTPDGKFLISAGDDHKVKIRNLIEESVKPWEPELDQLFSLAVSPDSKIIAVGGVKPLIKLRNIQTDKDIQTLKGHKREILGLAFSPDGKKLVSSSYDQTVRLWDVETGDEIQQFEGQLVWTYKVEFSPDGQFLAFGSVNNTLCLYQVNTDTNKYELLHHCLGHKSNILSVAFSPNSEIVASGSSDETIKLWDTKTGDCLATLEVERPYQGMKIRGIEGLKEVEEKTLKALGAEL